MPEIIGFAAISAAVISAGLAFVITWRANYPILAAINAACFVISIGLAFAMLTNQ